VVLRASLAQVLAQTGHGEDALREAKAAAAAWAERDGMAEERAQILQAEVTAFAALDRHDDARQSHIHASISSPPPAAKTRHATQEAIVLLSRRACVEAGNPAPTSIFPQSGRSPRVLTFCPMWRVHAAAHSIYEGKIMPTADSTRSIWSHGFFITIIGLLFLAGPLPAPAQTLPEPLDNVPMTKIVEFENIDMLTKEGLSSDSGEVSLYDIQGDVILALAYWEGIDHYEGGNGIYDSANIVLDGVPVTGEVMYAGGDDHGWPTSVHPNRFDSVSYRADVTEIVQAKGAGRYAYSGLESGPGDFTRGISIIVYYDDGNPDNDVRVAHYEGKQSNCFKYQESPPLFRDMLFDFTHDYIGGGVEVVLHVSDGQTSLPDGPNYLYTWPGADNTGNTWGGLLVGGPNGPWKGNYWDIAREFIHHQYLSGRRTYTHQFKQPSYNDCVTLHVAQVVSATDLQPLTLDPLSHDFGAVPIGQIRIHRFTFTNTYPEQVNIRADTGVSYTNDARSAIVGDTCSGNSLAPGETCVVTVRYGRLAGGTANRESRNLSIKVERQQLWTLNASFRAQIWGSIVDGTVPSNGAIEPTVCRFPDTPRNGTSNPIRFTVRNRGAEAVEARGVTLTPVLQSAAGKFHIVGNDCPASGPFPAGASCHLDIEFHPGAGNVGNGYHNLLSFLHTTAEGDDVWLAQVSGYVASAAAGQPPSAAMGEGDPLFDDSFEGDDPPPQPTGCI